jgi:hypothetical protein
MNETTLARCKWCAEPIEARRLGQKFCCRQHRYLWHRNQRISPGQLDARIREVAREIAREEIEKALPNRGD